MRLEEEGRDQHHRHQPGVAQVLVELLHHAAQRKDDRVESRHHAQGGQCVGVPAPEDDVHVHQAVAHNRIGQRERNQHHAQHAHLHVRIRHRAQHVRQYVERRERHDSPKRSVAQPLQLLPHHHVFGPAVFLRQDQRPDQIGQRPRHHPGPIHHPAQFQQRHGDLHGTGTEGHERQEHQGRRHVKQNRARHDRGTRAAALETPGRNAGTRSAPTARPPGSRSKSPGRAY